MMSPVCWEALMSQPSMTCGSIAVPSPPVTPLFAVSSALPSMKIGPWAASVPEGKSAADGLAHPGTKRTRTNGAQASARRTESRITSRLNRGCDDAISLSCVRYGGAGQCSSLRTSDMAICRESYSATNRVVRYAHDAIHRTGGVHGPDPAGGDGQDRLASPGGSGRGRRGTGNGQRDR